MNEYKVTTNRKPANATSSLSDPERVTIILADDVFMESGCACFYIEVGGKNTLIHILKRFDSVIYLGPKDD